MIAADEWSVRPDPWPQIVHTGLRLAGGMMRLEFA
jgi:hypothetical protein